MESNEKRGENAENSDYLIRYCKDASKNGMNHLLEPGCLISLGNLFGNIRIASV